MHTELNETRSQERKIIGTRINEFGKKVRVVRIKKKKGLNRSRRDNESMLASEVNDI